MTDKNAHAFSEKWGEAAKAGFLMVPDVLLKYQGALGLTATELVVLLNLSMNWWFANRLPRPRTTSIANRMNVEPRTVQRALQSLQLKGLVARISPDTADIKKSAAIWDLSGLVTRLESIAKNDPAYLHRTGQRASEKQPGWKREEIGSFGGYRGTSTN